LQPQALNKATQQKIIRLVRPFKELKTSTVDSIMAAHVALDGRQISSIVHNLVPANLQCTLYRKIKVRLQVGGSICLRNSCLSTFLDIYYLNTFFASLYQVTAKLLHTVFIGTDFAH